MDTKVKAPNALKKSIFRTDPSRRKHFIHAKTSGSSIESFKRFQLSLFRDGFDSLTGAGQVLACLAGFDGLTTEADLQVAYAACAGVSRWRGAVKINWLAGMDRDERNLSPMTVLALQRAGKLESYEQAKASLLDFLAHSQESASPGLLQKNSLEQVLQDGLSWHQACLPPVLYGHVNGAARMAALPISAHAREESMLALKKVPVDPDDPAGAGQYSTAYARAFDAAMVGFIPTALSGIHFIKKMNQALTPPPKGSNATKRQVVREKMQKLGAEIDDQDELCALLYLFALDLIESGTRRKKKLAPATPWEYMRSFAADFHAQANGLILLNIDADKYSTIYRNLLPDSENAASYKVAGLKAFHLFLRGWWEVPKLPQEIFAVDTDTPVAANIVWLHELERIHQWIDSVAPSRFMDQLKVAFAICGSAMVRISELLVLRCINVIDEKDHFVIEISRSIVDGSEKTGEGRRRVYIREPAAVLILRAWYERRVVKERKTKTATDADAECENAEDAENDAADLNDYFFGDPTDPTKIADRGKMYHWMNRLLKESTGDDSISVHSLRHSVGTQRLKEILENDCDHEVDPMDVLANEAGHVGGHVTASHYGHLFAGGIRIALDQDLVWLANDYSTVSRWTGMNEATLRQRVKRAADRGIARESALFSVLAEAVAAVKFPSSSASIALVEPSNPLPKTVSEELRYTKVLGFMADMAAGLSSSQARLRQDLEEKISVQILQRVGQFGENHGDAGIDLYDDQTHGLKALNDESGKTLGFPPDFGRLRQPRWRLLVDGIAKVDSFVLSESIHYWQRALQGSHLAVRPGPGWVSLTLPLKCVALSPTITRPFCAVPRTSVAQTASG